ncbi:unnamed protein product, partial [Gongylonema pulchrum]|uniref:Chitin-binding type-2 domain-containing protein n=1 Tax=Gongylonema pulchrum TaxID=637853 RepID=A0A183DKF5_9BILA
MSILHFLARNILSSFILSSLFSQNASAAVAQNGICDTSRDIFLRIEPSGNPQVYLHCISVGFGTLGVWQLESCPAGQIFFYSEQRCISVEQRIAQEMHELPVNSFI